MMFIDFLEKIDWPALRKQKIWLIEQKAPEADGVLHLLDDLMDIAVDKYNIPEAKVFPTITGESDERKENIHHKVSEQKGLEPGSRDV
jgi:hypothetical protein